MDDRTMDDSTERPAGAPAPAAAPAEGAVGAEGMLPTPMDALGRELVAIRAMAVALISMVDATLTNYRHVQMVQDHTAAMGRTAAGRPAGAPNAISRILELVEEEKARQRNPATFGAKHRTGQDSEGAAEDADASPTLNGSH